MAKIFEWLAQNGSQNRSDRMNRSRCRHYHVKTWFSDFFENFQERIRRTGKNWMAIIRKWGSQFLSKYPEVIKIKRATLISLIVFAILLSSFFSIMLVSCIYDGNQPIETTVPPIESNTTTPTVTLTPTITETPTTEPLPDHK